MSNLSPYQLLANYAEQITSSAKNNKSQISSDDQRYVKIYAGQSWLVNLEEIKEVIIVPNIYCIPNVLAWVKGLITWHKEVVPVFDLSWLALKVFTKIDFNSKILILKHNNQYVGLLVQKVFGLQRTQLNQVSQEQILNCTKLLAESQFSQIQKQDLSLL